VAGPAQDPFTASRLARACALAEPPPADAARLIGWARPAVKAQATEPSYQHTLGLAHLRAGHWDEAARHLRDADRGWAVAPLNWLGLALVHGRRGQPAEARRWLDKANAVLDRTSPATWPTWDWLEAQVLRREAETLLKAPPPPVRK
jgi:Flp pilus assembly protein TadD